jgi:signal transduction histidine kinase
MRRRDAQPRRRTDAQTHSGENTAATPTRVIFGNARRGRLVDDLLGLARLEARPAREEVLLGALVRSAVEEAQARAPAARVTISADGNPAVLGDADALSRALRNFLENALAAIPAAGEVHVRVARVDGTVEAQITDNGPGVPEAERERIFGRFVRLGTAKPGSGLGLAIARRSPASTTGS